jgi:dihydrofolate synthase/folylpolyglutamate synthase
MLLAGRDWHARGRWTSFTVDGPWGSYEGLRSGLIGGHQIENAGGAIAATWLLGHDGFAVSESAARRGVAAVQWPGRAEVVTRPGEPRYIIDGAHTPASAAALAATVANLGGDRATVLVLAMMADKDPATLIRALAPIARRVVATTNRSPRSLPADAIATAAAGVGLPTETAADVPQALAKAGALAGPEGQVLVTGSLTTVAEAREALGLATPDPPLAPG